MDFGLPEIFPPGKTIHPGNRPYGPEMAGQDEGHEQQNNLLVLAYAGLHVRGVC